MREQINENELNEVVGGTVVISRDKMRVAFTSTRERFNLMNVDFKTARNLADELWENNTTLGDAEFDALVKSEFQARGWI